MLMIVLRSPIVADLCAAVHREELRLVRREALKASKAPEGYSRFDVAVAEAVRATGWPEHKARRALMQAVAAGQLTAHDHECVALTIAADRVDEHHFIPREALTTWLARFRTVASPTAAQTAKAEVQQGAAEPEVKDHQDTAQTAAAEMRTKMSQRLDAIVACIRDLNLPPMKLPRGTKKRIQARVEKALPELFPEHKDPNSAVFQEAWKEGSARLFGTSQRAVNAGSRARPPKSA